jgi:hypothetical protein
MISLRPSCPSHEFTQQFETLRAQLGGDRRQAGDIAAGPRQAGDELGGIVKCSMGRMSW